MKNHVFAFASGVGLFCLLSDCLSLRATAQEMNVAPKVSNTNQLAQDYDKLSRI